MASKTQARKSRTDNRLSAIDHIQLERVREQLGLTSTQFNKAISKPGRSSETVITVRRERVCFKKTIKDIETQCNNKLRAKFGNDFETVSLLVTDKTFAAQQFMHAATKVDFHSDNWWKRVWKAVTCFKAAINDFESNLKEFHPAAKEELVKHSNALMEVYEYAWERTKILECTELSDLMIAASRDIGDDPVNREWSHKIAVRFHELGLYYSADLIATNAEAFSETNPRPGNSRAALANAHILHRSALLAGDKGDFKMAERLIAKSRSIKEWLKNEEEIISDKITQGLLSALQGRFAEAVPMLKECLAEVENIEKNKTKLLPDHRIEARFRLARTFRWMGQFDEANKLLKEAEALKGFHWTPRQNIHVHVEKALLEISCGRTGYEEIERVVPLADENMNLEFKGIGLGRDASNLALAILLASPIVHEGNWSNIMESLFAHLSRTPVGVRYRASTIFGMWKAETISKTNSRVALLDEAYALFVEGEAFSDALIHRNSLVYDLYHWKGVALAGQGKIDDAKETFKIAAKQESIGVNPLIKLVLGRLAKTGICRCTPEELAGLSNCLPQRTGMPAS